MDRKMVVRNTKTIYMRMRWLKKGDLKTGGIAALAHKVFILMT